MFGETTTEDGIKSKTIDYTFAPCDDVILRVEFSTSIAYSFEGGITRYNSNNGFSVSTNILITNIHAGNNFISYGECSKQSGTPFRFSYDKSGLINFIRFLFN